MYRYYRPTSLFTVTKPCAVVWQITIKPIQIMGYKHGIHF